MGMTVENVHSSAFCRSNILSEILYGRQRYFILPTELASSLICVYHSNLANEVQKEQTVQ